MTFGVGRSLILALVALTAAACQSSDTTPQPAFASSYDQIQTSGMPATAVAPTQNSRYFIEFRSRYALTYGHTYVVFGRLNQAGQMVKPEVAGLAPKSDDPNVYVLGHVLAVPASTGWTDGDLEEEYRSASWRVMLTEAEYRRRRREYQKAAGKVPLLARVALQLQRIRSGHRPIHGV